MPFIHANLCNILCIPSQSWYKKSCTDRSRHSSSIRNNANNATAAPSSDSATSASASTTSSANNWREWFASSDYDGAWSSYQPLTQTALASSRDNNNQQHQHTLLVNSIQNGTWQRRRHGMNLEPLEITLTFHYEMPVDDSDDHVVAEEEEEGEESQEKQLGLIQQHQQKQQEQEDKVHSLDVQTRYLISMLDDLFRTGIRRETDRPSTERCHRVSSSRLYNIVNLICHDVVGSRSC